MTSTVPSTAKRSTATADGETFIVLLHDQKTGHLVTGKLLNERVSATKRITRAFKSGESGIEVYTTMPGVSSPQKGDFHFRVKDNVAIYLTSALNLN